MYAPENSPSRADRPNGSDRQRTPTGAVYRGGSHARRLPGSGLSVLTFHKGLRGRQKSLIAILLLVLAGSAWALRHTTTIGAQWSDPPLLASQQPASSPATGAVPVTDTPPTGVEEPVTGTVPVNRYDPRTNPPAAGPGGTGSAKPTPTPGTLIGQITGIGGMCVDVAGADESDRTPVQLHPCTGGLAQRWVVGVDHTIRAFGKCMDVRSGRTGNGARVQIISCHGSVTQRWTYSSGRLINADSGRCLDATDMSSADGTRLQIWDCTGNSNQNWTLPR